MPHPKRFLPPLPMTFSVREALAAGATQSELRHASLQAPHYGVRTTAPEVPESATLRLQTLSAAIRILPRLRHGEAVSHTSALLLHSCPVRTQAELHVTAQPGYGQNRTHGVKGHRHTRPTQISRIDGIPVALPLTALLQSARMLPLRELVVAIDHLVQPRGFAGNLPPLARPELLIREGRSFHGRGARLLRQALELSSVGSESRMETLTRIVLHAFGLADYFELQVELSDADGWVGRFDLVDLQHKVIVEFDGDQHRTNKTQYAKDIRRLDRARATGYAVIRLLASDILDTPLATATRVAAAVGVPLVPDPLSASLLCGTKFFRAE